MHCEASCVAQIVIVKRIACSRHDVIVNHRLLMAMAFGKTAKCSVRMQTETQTRFVVPYWIA